MHYIGFAKDVMWRSKHRGRVFHVIAILLIRLPKEVARNISTRTKKRHANAAASYLIYPFACARAHGPLH